jgi:tRNA(Ile)-lysidine synthetase-like protein
MTTYFLDLVYKYSLYNLNYLKFKDVLEFVPKNTERIVNQTFNKEYFIDNCIRNFCEKNNKNNKNNKFCISLSGGVDSMVLATIMKILGCELIAVHINYNNRDETLLEQQFLEEWCKYNDIKLYVKTIENIKRANTKRSDYEYITKNMRLDFYKEVLNKEKLDLILLAHHKDDIVENIFANVCRGRYILDLAVIKEFTTMNNINIGRPLIEFYKQSILEFAEKYQVPYFKDTTPDWSVRGKYRRRIYPLIEDAFTKNVKDNLIGLSVQSYEWNELIKEDIIKPFMNKVKFTFDINECYVEFNITKYKNYPLCFWNVVLMNVFNQSGYNCPSRKGIQNYMNNINKDINTHNVNISISNNCKCSLKNDNIKFEFKFNK